MLGTAPLVKMLGTAPLVIMAPAPNEEQRDYHETWHGKNDSRQHLKPAQPLAGEARTKLEAERTNA
jgi:hypothetical protein